MTSRKKTSEETTQPISKKDFINSVIKKRQKNKFLTENSCQLLNSTSIDIGVFYNGQLVGVSSFNKKNDNQRKG